MNNPQQPREYDAVLGGNSPSLEGAAVLGGIEGVKLRLQNPDAKVRIAALEQALNYGEQGLDLVIAGLKDESWDVEYAAYSLLKSRTEARVKEALIIFDLVTLKSAVRMDYSGLRDLLAQGKWWEADRETRRVMLAFAIQEMGLKPEVTHELDNSDNLPRYDHHTIDGTLVKYSDGRYWYSVYPDLDVEQIDNFPCEDLRTIDNLWVKYSDGRFGFSVQKRIYQEFIENGYEYGSKDIWEAFGDKIGWTYETWTTGEKCWSCSGTSDITSPKGKLPCCPCWSYDRDHYLVEIGEYGSWDAKWTYLVVLALFLRMETCNL